MSNEIICTVEYSTTIEELRKQTQHNTKVLHKLRAEYFKEEIADEIATGEGPVARKAALKIADDFLSGQCDLTSNSDNESVSDSLETRKQTLNSQLNEQFLMLALPLDRGKRIFLDDCGVRESQNKTFISTYQNVTCVDEQNQEYVTYEQILLYRQLACCFCDHCRGFELIKYHVDLQGERREAEIVDIQKCHHSAPNRLTALHRFLHVTCKNTLVGEIIFNGHGCEYDSEDNSRSNSEMCFNYGGDIQLDKILEDIKHCFSSIPPDEPPYQVNVVFAQCYGDGYNTKYNTNVHPLKRLRVRHLVRSKRTYDVTTNGAHIPHLHLDTYADNRKKEAERIAVDAVASSLQSVAVDEVHNE